MPYRRRLKQSPTLSNRLRAFGAGLAVAAGLAWGIPAAAAEPSIRVTGGASMDAFASGIDRLGQSILSDMSAARTGVGEGEVRYFDLNRPLSDVAGFDALPAADRVMMRGAKRTYDLFRALGGPRIDSFAVAGTARDRYYLSLDGEGGRWLATPGAALAGLARQMVDEQVVLLKGAGGGSRCPLDFRCLLKSVYETGAPKIATVPRGTTLDLEMTGENFSNQGGKPVVITPDGITTHDVTFVDPEKITARISIDGDAPPGLQPVQVFNPGKQFGSQQRYDILVMSGLEELEAAANGPATDGMTGTGKVEPLADDYPGQVDGAVPLETSLAGRLEVSGDSDLFRVEVASPGALAIESEGPTDVVGELRDAKGNLIAADDDGGARYNFRLAAPVPAGTYFLRVRHCCAGRGTYRLNRIFTEN